MTTDKALLNEVDHVIPDFKTTRSASIRSALKLALRQHADFKLEQQHKED